MLDIGNPLLEEEKVNLSGVILAGGKSRIMGESHKALLTFHNEKLIHRQIRRLRQICTEIILVTNEPRVFLPLVDCDVRIITDYYFGKGPLGGMHAAFSLARNSAVWVVGCDLPFISPRAAKLMLAKKEKMNSDAVIPYIEDRLYPLHGIYDKRCVDLIPRIFNEGQHRVASFLEVIRYEQVTKLIFQNDGIDAKFVLNVNTPEEYERILFMDKPSRVNSSL